MKKEMKTDIRLLFLCDREACLQPCYEECKHTSELKHAVHRKEFEADPIKFISEHMRCEDSDPENPSTIRSKIFLVEVEDE